MAFLKLKGTQSVKWGSGFPLKHEGDECSGNVMY